MKFIIFLVLLGVAVAQPVSKTNEQQRVEEPIVSDVKSPVQHRVDPVEQQKVEVAPVQQEQIKQEKVEVPDSKIDMSNYMILVPVSMFRDFVNLDNVNAVNVNSNVNTERTSSLSSFGGGSSHSYGGYGGSSGGFGGLGGGVRSEGMQNAEFNENIPFQPARGLLAPLAGLLNPFATLTGTSA